MTQEEKNLLLKDLCARLPYGVKFLRESWNYEWDQELSVIEVLEDIDKDGYINNTKVYKVEDIKPYLRPMSSMTEEEREELKELTAADIVTNTGFGYKNLRGMCFGMMYIDCQEIIDWFNKKMFDFRGLIPKDLALSTEVFNPYKD